MGISKSVKLWQTPRYLIILPPLFQERGIGGEAFNQAFFWSVQK
jgi:hypothetical protein